MKFENLIIKNFKCFLGKHEFKCDPPGLYLIRGSNLVEPELGANGAGKSTIEDAFFWVFTGKTIGDNRPGDSVEPWDLAVKQSVSVEIDFQIGSQHRRLVRTRKPNSLKLDGAEINQDDIANILAMSEDNLRRTLILGQKGDLFLDLRPEQQSAMFTDMLNLEPYLSAADQAREIASLKGRILIDISNKISGIEGRLEEVRSNLKRYSGLAQGFKRERREKLITTKKSFAEAQHELENHVGKKPVEPHSSRAISELADQVNDLNKQIDDDNSYLNTMDRQRAALEAKLQHIDRELESYRNTEGTCPACGQVVSKQHITRKVVEAEKEIERVKPKLAQFAKSYTEVDRHRNRSIKQRDDLRNEFVKLKDHNAGAENALAEWQRRNHSLEVALAIIERDLNVLLDQENPYLKEMYKLEEVCESYESDLDVENKRREDAEWSMKAHEFWGAAFREIRLNLIDQVLTEIEIAANREAEALGLRDWRIEFATEKQSKDRISRGFQALIYPPGADQPVRWESYSGGEEQRWRLAVTFALSDVLLARSGIEANVEMIDEPTTHMSPEGIDDLLECLRQRSLDLGRAIYFIDHHVLDRGDFDDTILVEKSKSGSRIVR